ncbi:MAG: hypothetical protein HF308_19885 [Ignavibacteria bacterium]|nr:hypothetical protein [Ignavibacteria bacterium]
MEISIITIAIAILIISSLLEAIFALLNLIKHRKRDPSVLYVITPALSVYVLYGLITTASVGAVTIYVYVTGGILILCGFLGIVASAASD